MIVPAKPIWSHFERVCLRNVALIDKFMLSQAFVKQYMQESVLSKGDEEKTSILALYRAASAYNRQHRY